MATSQQNDYYSSEESSIFLDTTVPNMARIFDYLVGGSTHFESDREAAKKMLKLIPSLQKWVRLRRAFIQEAVHTLSSEGFAQFLDFGSGMPSNDHIHQFAPNAHVIYSDINPVAVSYGNSLFQDLDIVDYIYGNATKVEEIFNHSTVKKLINSTQKVAIGLNTLLLFLPSQDNKQLAQKLFDWAPIGSKIFLVFQTRADVQMPHRYEEFIALTQKAGLPLNIQPLAYYIELLRPWKPASVVPLTDFLGLPDDFISEADQEGVGMMFYAAFLTK
ncbi:MAG: hypothetical protein GY943_05725 [Chloroflexi bacterium]|nr:hypothetical protein [Chloroflexota bacterium]